MRLVLVIVALATLAACAGDRPVLTKRVTFWRDALSQGAPIGSTVEKVREWGTRYHVSFQYLEQQHWLYANVEQVPEEGMPFPCSQWNIILKVTIDPTGHSTENEVSTVGTCL